MQDRETNRSRGFGFVIFEEISSAYKVLSEQFVEIGGRKVEVKAALPKEVLVAHPSEHADRGVFAKAGNHYTNAGSHYYHMPALPPSKYVAYGVAMPTHMAPITQPPLSYGVPVMGSDGSLVPSLQAMSLQAVPCPPTSPLFNPTYPSMVLPPPPVMLSGAPNVVPMAHYAN